MTSVKIIDGYDPIAKKSLEANQLDTDCFIEEEIHKDDFSPLIRQIFAASGPLIMTFGGGMTSGFSAILLPQLRNESTIIARTIDINLEQESWIASMAPLPMALGCIFGGFAMEKYGRKNSNYIAYLLNIIGWIAIYMAYTFEALLLGRFITGLCVGLSGPGSTSYIAEIATPKYRGILLSCISLGISGGLLITHLLGTFFTWTTTALVSIALPIVCTILTSFAPESPIWYINNNKIKEGKASFHWLKGYGCEASDELKNILNAQSLKPKMSVNEAMRVIRKAQFVKPLIIMNLFFITVQFSGANAVVFYSVSIMQKCVPSLNKYVAMIIIDVIRVGMAIFACILTKRYRIRPLTIISGIGTTIALLTLALFVRLATNNPQNATIGIIPIISLVGYITFISVGLVPLPWTICGEIFAPVTKGLGTGISTTVNFLAFFVVVKTSPTMFAQLGTEGTFITYGCFAALGTFILWLILPETKNKTLNEIENHFRSKKKPIGNKIII